MIRLKQAFIYDFLKYIYYIIFEPGSIHILPVLYEPRENSPFPILPDEPMNISMQWLTQAESLFPAKYPLCWVFF